MVETFIQKLGFRKFKAISFGLVAALFLLWAIFNSFTFVPEGQETKWLLVFLSYGILGTYVFARDDLRDKLFNIGFFRAMIYFIPALIISLIAFYFIFGLVNPLPQVALSILIGIPLWLSAVHAFIFATVETSFWQGHLDGKVGILFSIISAGIFHMFIWTGPAWLNFLGAAFLFLFFSMVHLFFGGFKSTAQQSKALIITIAVHTAYNFIKLGIILKIGGVA